MEFMEEKLPVNTSLIFQYVRGYTKLGNEVVHKVVTLCLDGLFKTVRVTEVTGGRCY